MSENAQTTPHDRRLDTLSLPVRITNWAERRGIETLLEIVRLHPRELLGQRNIGRTSLAHLHEVIRAEYGAEWEELWRELRTTAPDPVHHDDPRDAPWDHLASAIPEWLLATSIDRLELPTRMRNFAERGGIETVAELLAIPRATLEETRNIGRGSIRDTRALLVERAGAGAGEAGASWNDLASALPDWLLGAELESLALPARMRTYVDSRGIATVAKLVAIPRTTLEREEKLGRVSVETTRQRLVEASAIVPRGASEYASFWALWLEKLGELDALDRMIVTQRCGIHGEARTLLAIGETLGVSRERVRQIESRAIRKVACGAWVEGSRARLAGALDGGALGLEELEARDPWFAPMNDDRREAFAYFLERIAGGTLAIATIEGRAIVATCSPEEVDASLVRARATLEALPCPADEGAVSGALAGAVPPSAPGLAVLIGEALEARIHRDEQGRMVAFGKTRDADVLAFLRQCAEPVTIHEVHAAVGGRGRFPDEVFYFERGVVGLEQHFPDYPKWKRRLIPICVRIMEADPRQWRVPEMLEAVREDALLPEWFGHWNLAEILRRSPEVRYLGRLRVTLPGVNDEERVHFARLTQRILREHGAPLAYDELLRRVTRETMVSSLAFRMMVIQAPFVAADDERIGLLARDVPGGLDAITRFSDALTEELSRREKGLSLSALAAFVTRLSDVHARWTVPMARGVARADARFQLSLAGGGAVGLAEWDDARVPTRPAIVRACVEEHGGRAPISAVLARVHAHHGARLDRRQLGALAYNAGVRLQGEELVMPERDDPARGVEVAGALPQLAEESRAIFEALLASPAEADRELLRALDAHVEMFTRAEAEGAPVDAAEAAFLRERCRALLTRASELGAHEQQLARAAARYFLLRDDADSDLSAGGLDDDDAVIGAVELHVSRAAARAVDRA